jgi:hypothetical protein
MTGSLCVVVLLLALVAASFALDLRRHLDACRYGHPRRRRWKAT